MKKKITIDILTLFPEFIESYGRFGIIARAVAHKVLRLRGVNLRQFSFDARGTVDGRPYGGGVGMVLRPDVMVKAIEKLRRHATKTRVVLLTPQGKVFSHTHAKRLAKYSRLILISGRYEGFDERITKFVDEQISIGDYVLMGGELPALVITEAVLRFIPSVLGKDESAVDESFTQGLLEYPQYTKPEVFKIKDKNLAVPKVLLSGHHQKIEAWRAAESLKRTKKIRPDLLLGEPKYGKI